MNQDGEGQFIQWRLDSCKTTYSPCEFPANGETCFPAFTFIPRTNVKQLAIKFVASINGSKPVVAEDHALENSNVIGGVEQIIYLTGRVPKENKGSLLKAQALLCRVDDQVVEMCAEANFILV